MANVDLSQQDLFEKQLFDAAKLHYGYSQSVQTKRKFDKAAELFQNHAVKLSKKIEKASDERKPITFIIGNGTSHARVVSIFHGKNFTSLDQLNAQVKKHFSKVEPMIKGFDDEKVNIQLVGATSKLLSKTEDNNNLIVACGEVVTSVRVHSFCHLK